jgi:hypothetical protein
MHVHGQTYCGHTRSLSVALEKAIAANKRHAGGKLAVGERRSDSHPLNDTRYCNALQQPAQRAPYHTDTKQDAAGESETNEREFQQHTSIALARELDDLTELLLVEMAPPAAPVDEVVTAGNRNFCKLHDVAVGTAVNFAPKDAGFGVGDQEAITKIVCDSDLSEPITMLLRAVILLSAGKSQELRTALIEGCAPMLCHLADKQRLVRWCKEVCKRENKKNGLFPAICTQMAQEILRIFSSRVYAAPAAGGVQTSQTEDNQSHADLQITQPQSATRAVPPKVPTPQEPCQKRPTSSVTTTSTTNINVDKTASPHSFSRGSFSRCSAGKASASSGTDAATITPRRLTPRMQAGIGIQLASDADGFPIIVEFEAGYNPSPDPWLNLEIGWRIMSVDSQHTQHVALAEVYKWLQVQHDR